MNFIDGKGRGTARTSLSQKNKIEKKRYKMSVGAVHCSDRGSAYSVARGATVVSGSSITTMSSAT